MAKRLIIVAAPSCCGKTTFVKQLYRGELPEIAEKCRFSTGGEWTYGDIWLEENNLLRQTTGPSLQFLLHYTLPYRGLNLGWLRRGFDKPSRLQILGSSNDIVVITLHASARELLRRVELRAKRMEELYRVERRMRTSAYLKARWGLRGLRALYRDPERLAETYSNWFTFLKGLDAVQLQVDVTDSPLIDEAVPIPEYQDSNV